MTSHDRRPATIVTVGRHASPDVKLRSMAGRGDAWRERGTVGRLLSVTRREWGLGTFAFRREAAR